MLLKPGGRHSRADASLETNYVPNFRPEQLCMTEVVGAPRMTCATLAAAVGRGSSLAQSRRELGDDLNSTMHSYRTKIKNGRAYVWGGDAMEDNCKCKFALVIRIDDDSPPVRLFTVKKDNDKLKEEVVGAMDCGSAFAVPLKGICGVRVECDDDASVTCTVLVQEYLL